MDRGKKVIGIALIILSITALISWEKWGKSRFLFDEIIVLKTNVTKGTVITEKILETKKVETVERGCLKKESMSNLIGKEAAQYIHKGVPLFKPYFDQKGLAVTEDNNQYVIALPLSWVVSMPVTLNRGNRVYLYAAGKLVTTALVSFFDQAEQGLEIVISSEQAEAISRTIERGDKFIVTYN